MGKKNDLRESLRLEVVCPAKARLLQGETDITLLDSNRRFIGVGQKSLWRWNSDFAELGMDLEEELRKIVQAECGNNYDIQETHFSGYLGVASNTSYKLVAS